MLGPDLGGPEDTIEDVRIKAEINGIAPYLIGTVPLGPIEGFARACFTYALGRNYPVYLSTKNTILKAYDGTFKDTFQRVFDADFKKAYDSMVAYRNDVLPWWQLNEYAFDTFMIRTRGRA